jgi:hypothetical protein
VPHGQNLAVLVRQFGDRAANALGELAGLGLAARRRGAVQQRPNHQQRRTLRQPHLAIQIAAGPLMIAAQIEQTFVGGFAHPQVKRHRLTLQKIVDAPHHFQLHFLHDIGRVQPRPQPRIEVMIDERAQFRPAARQQLLQGLAVAVADPIEQGTRLRGIRVQLGHSLSPLINPPYPEKCDSGKKNLRA